MVSRRYACSVGGFAKAGRARYLWASDAMTRLPGFSSVRACVAWFVTLLQVVGALHFALVPHGYSAALGGVVHVHSVSASAVRRVAERGPALRAATATCISERCPVADAPQSSPPCFDLQATGSVEFGEARLLGERAARVPESLRLFLSAPKTSPPV